MFSGVCVEILEESLFKCQRTIFDEWGRFYQAQSQDTTRFIEVLSISLGPTDRISDNDTFLQLHLFCVLKHHFWMRSAHTRAVLVFKA